ncbi:hypothetical protein [Cyprinid herpesvirus 2]|nr:hypothetical protein [Cyprinid herpesvirus 2]
MAQHLQAGLQLRRVQSHRAVLLRLHTTVQPGRHEIHTLHRAGGADRRGRAQADDVQGSHFQPLREGVGSGRRQDRHQGARLSSDPQVHREREDAPRLLWLLLGQRTGTMRARETGGRHAHHAHQAERPSRSQGRLHHQTPQVERRRVGDGRQRAQTGRPAGVGLRGLYGTRVEGRHHRHHTLAERHRVRGHALQQDSAFAQLVLGLSEMSRDGPGGMRIHLGAHGGGKPDSEGPGPGTILL